MTKTYLEAIEIQDFNERFEYLKLNGGVGTETFGYDRYLNQILYHSSEWRSIRRKVIIRDECSDLAHPNFPINGKVLIHHINPITEKDILERRPIVFDLNNLICVSHETHNALHYGLESVSPRSIINERTKNDTIPWRK